MTDELRALWRMRQALQLLAALTGEEGFCDVAGGLDAIAALLWKAVRG